VEFATLDDLELSDSRVLIRADLNVPVKDGKTVDTTRITACAATIHEVIERGGTPIVISHLGRPKGEADSAYSLKPVAAALGEVLDGRKVAFAKDCVGAAAREVLDSLQPGEVALLENLRFHPGEKDNDPQFADALARLGDVYVNDAFSAAHRAHASVVGLPERLPAAAGRLMERELSSLEHWLASPRKPFMAVLGGAKVKTKLHVAEALLNAGADVFLAGGLANTALLAQGREIGKSISDSELCEQAERLIARADEVSAYIILPEDVVIAPDVDMPESASTVDLDEVPADGMILDLGPRSLEAMVDHLDGAATVVWNGPLGVAEEEAFADGTLSLARAIAERSETQALVSVVGGGDTLAALKRAGLLDHFTYASMAGGAFLAWLAGDRLPGVEALKRASARRRSAARRRGPEASVGSPAGPCRGALKLR
jgi:phosphoglycerate kinase